MDFLASRRDFPLASALPVPLHSVLHLLFRGLPGLPFVFPEIRTQIKMYAAPGGQGGAGKWDS